MSPRIALLLGLLFSALSVAVGAFGTHGLEPKLPVWYVEEAPRMLARWETGARYQFYHSLALIALGLWGEARSGRRVGLVGWSFFVGILLFSGPLYAMVLTGRRAFGAIVVFGGISFLIGWTCWMFQVLSEKPTSSGSSLSA